MRVKTGQELKVKSRKSLICYLLLFVMVIVSSCAVVKSESITKIALLAPFEGRYREIGYNALYAVRLAIQDSGRQDIDLLAVDDGGTVETAIDRIRALNIDPTIEAIIVLGQFASHPDAQQANDKPLIIIGYWGHDRGDDDTLMAVNQDIINQTVDTQDITILDLDESTIGHDLFTLEQMTDLYSDLDNIQILSSGTLPNAEFAERYINSDLYVPNPNLLATLIYDITGLILNGLQSNTSLAEMTYKGINGAIQFTDGYWQDASIHRYRFDNGILIAGSD